MAIEINPRRINSGTRPTAQRGQTQQDSNDSPLIVPKRAVVNNIPSPDSLSTLIRAAVASLRKGVLWDRGTILNIIA